MKMTIKELQEKVDYLNLSAVCKIAGLNYQSIASKIRNQKELTVIESEFLEQAIKKIL
jgi:hypothetical protein